MACQKDSAFGGPKNRRGIVFYLRLGLLGIAVLTAISLVLAFISFSTTTRVLSKITHDAIPTIDQAIQLLETARSIESQARNLPNLHEAFAIGTTAYNLKQLSKRLLDEIAQLDESIVEASTIDRVVVSVDVLNRQIHHLISLVELRSLAEKKQEEFVRLLDELHVDLEGPEDFQAGTQPVVLNWNRPIARLLLASNYLITSLATDDPARVIISETEYLTELAAIKNYLSDKVLPERPMVAAVIKNLDVYSSILDERIHRMKLELRINQAIKGLVIIDRLVDQVGSISRDLSRTADNKAKVINRDTAWRFWVLAAISVGCVIGLISLIFFINYRIVARMGRLQDAMHSYVKGTPLPLSTAGHDEISDMARSFLFYVEEVKNRENRLEERRKELDAALKDLTEKSNILNTTMQSMEQGIIMVDRDMRVLSYNDNLARLFSLDPDFVAATKKFEDLQIKILEVSSLDANSLEQCLEIQKRPESLTFEHPLADGRVLEIQQSPLADGGFVRTYKDITERRRAEVRFQTMAANLPGAIFQAKILPEGRMQFLYVSPGSREHFHLSPEDLIAGRQRMEIHPEDRERYRQTLLMALESGQDLEFVGKLSTTGKDRKWIRIGARGSRDPDGGLTFNGLLLDITRRKMAEFEYLASERKIMAMSQAVDDALVMVDNQGLVNFWNQAAEKLFGFSKQEALGLDFHEIAAPEKDHEKARAGLRRFAGNGQGEIFGHRFEALARNRQGDHFPVELSISSFQLDDEWFAVGTVRDITERKKVEEEIGRHVEDLERFNRLVVGREEKMIKLKNEINELRINLGQEPKYRIVE